MNKADYKVTKLDRRMSGYGFYKYHVTPNVFERSKIAELLIELRNWCWATYGPGAELGFTRRGALWAWDTEYGRRRIYLKSDAELTMLELIFN